MKSILKVVAVISSFLFVSSGFAQFRSMNPYIQESEKNTNVKPAIVETKATIVSPVDTAKLRSLLPQDPSKKSISDSVFKRLSSVLDSLRKNPGKSNNSTNSILNLVNADTVKLLNLPKKNIDSLENFGKQSQQPGAMKEEPVPLALLIPYLDLKITIEEEIEKNKDDSQSLEPLVKYLDTIYRTNDLWAQHRDSSATLDTLKKHQSTLKAFPEIKNNDEIKAKIDALQSQVTASESTAIINLKQLDSLFFVRDRIIDSISGVLKRSDRNRLKYILDSLRSTVHPEKYTWVPQSYAWKGPPGTTKNARILWGEYEKTSLLDNVNVTFNDSTNSFSLELFKSYLGPLRLSVGSVITSSKNDSTKSGTVNNDSTASGSSTTKSKTDKPTLDQFLAGGGTISLALGYPLFGYVPDVAANSGWFNLLDFVQTRGALNFKGAGTGGSSLSNPTTGNIYVYDELDCLFYSEDRNFVFFTQAEYGGVFGPQSFYDAVGHSYAFQSASLSIGCNLLSRFAIMYKHPIRFPHTQDLVSDVFAIQLSQAIGSADKPADTTK